MNRWRTALPTIIRGALRQESLPPSRTAQRSSAAHVPKRDWRKGHLSSSLSRQTQHMWMWRFVQSARVQHLRGRGRCLDWDGWYGGSIFDSLCAEVDVIVYSPRGHGPIDPPVLKWASRNRRQRRAMRGFRADAHTMASVLPRGAYDLVIANSVFEHLREPDAAMREVAALLRPGGLLFWHTPFLFEEHGVPSDFWRYTVAGARLLAESAGCACRCLLPARAARLALGGGWLLCVVAFDGRL